MQNLSDISEQYVHLSYTPELQANVFTAFSLLEMFGLSFYEDKYLNLIAKDESMDGDTRRDTFILYLKQDLYALLQEHSIHVSEDADVTLTELNELVHFLYIIQNLEDYGEVSYRLHADQSNRKTLIDLISRYSLLTTVRLYELIDVVEENLIDSLRQYTKDKELESTIPLDQKHLKYVNYFLDFTKGTASIGATLYIKGYQSLELKELLNIITANVPEHIDNLCLKSDPQAGLDVFSMLVITKDDYDIPLFKLKQNIHLFTNSLENATKITALVTNMLNDFTNYIKAREQSEKLHGN